MIKKLAINFSSLTILQISNYLIPLITIPYLVRVLGTEKYGLINFAAAFIAYFVTLTDYGFNLSAPREISVNRNDSNKLVEIISSVVVIKTILFLVSAVILITLVESISIFKLDRAVYYLSFLFVLGNVIFPQWFFQGIEDMKYITIINVVFKSCATILIFIVIKNQSDYLKLIAINSGMQILIGLAGMLFLIFKFKMKLVIPSISNLLYYLKDARHIFYSTAAINLYTTSNTFILGLFASQSAVGYFAAADKIRIAFQSLFAIVSNTIYPHVSLLIKESLNAGIKFISKIIKTVGSLALVSSILTFVFAEEIILIFLGSEYANSIFVLKIISFLPFLIFLSNVTGIQIMLNAGFQKEFSLIIIFAAVINIILSIIIVPIYFEIGSAVSVLITEIFVTTAIIIFLRKNGVSLFSYSKKKFVNPS